MMALKETATLARLASVRGPIFLGVWVLALLVFGLG